MKLGGVVAQPEFGDESLKRQRGRREKKRNEKMRICTLYPIYLSIHSYIDLIRDKALVSSQGQDQANEGVEDDLVGWVKIRYYGRRFSRSTSTVLPAPCHCTK